MRSRTLVNLITVILASAVLALYALTQLVAGAVFGQGYALYVPLPEAGGLTENKQVTYRGVGVGTIADVEIEEDHVLVEMEIDQGAQIPIGVDVIVLRQSAVGEQALDFRPRAPEAEATQYYEEGDRVEPLTVTMPTKPEELLVLADSVFGSVDEENAATVIAELADTVRGRSEDIQSILVDSASLSESVGDNGTNYDRLFAASRIVNASLAENRVALASLITDLADGAELIGEIRGEVDGLLDIAPPTLATTTSVLERGDANLACSLEDLANLNEFVNTPPNLFNLAEALRTNSFFFDAFRIIAPTSPQGDPWVRVQFIVQPAPVPLRYVPQRPIPDTLPGGACESVFGPGAGAAVQPNHQLAVPEGQVVRPANDRQTSITTAGTTAPPTPARTFMTIPGLTDVSTPTAQGDDG